MLALSENEIEKQKNQISEEGDDIFVGFEEKKSAKQEN